MMKCDLNKFCYVCGQYICKKNMQRKLNSDCSNAYKSYFHKSLIKDKKWAPKTVCKNCYNRLLEWKNHKHRGMLFTTPMIWSNPGIHKKTNCYVCANSGRYI